MSEPVGRRHWLGTLAQWGLELSLLARRLLRTALIAGLGVAALGYGWAWWRGGDPLQTVDGFLQWGGAIILGLGLWAFNPLSNSNQERFYGHGYLTRLPEHIVEQSRMQRWGATLDALAAGLGCWVLDSLLRLALRLAG